VHAVGAAFARTFDLDARFLLPGELRTTSPMLSTQGPHHDERGTLATLAIAGQTGNS
jgi:hypothetical protein